MELSIMWSEGGMGFVVEGESQGRVSSVFIGLVASACFSSVEEVNGGLPFLEGPDPEVKAMYLHASNCLCVTMGDTLKILLGEALDAQGKNMYLHASICLLSEGVTQWRSSFLQNLERLK